MPTILLHDTAPVEQVLRLTLIKEKIRGFSHSSAAVLVIVRFLESWDSLAHPWAKLLGFKHPHLLCYRSFQALLLVTMYRGVFRVFLTLRLATTWHFLDLRHDDLPRAINQLIIHVTSTILSYQRKFPTLHRSLFLFKWHQNLIKLFIPSMLLFLADHCPSRELLHIVKLLFSLWRQCFSKKLLTFLFAYVFNLLDQILEFLEIVLFIASIRW